MTPVFRHPAFLDDAASAYAFLAQQSPRAADRLLDALEAAIMLIAAFPGIGRPRDALAPGARSYLLRRFRFVIFYRAEPGAVRLLRLLHGARNVGADLLRKTDT